MRVLAIDIGGTNVKVLATGEIEARRFPSGPKLTPRKMVGEVRKLTGDWKYDVISIGYPGRVVEDHPITEPRNLAHGWVGFDFAKAFGRPVRVINDAAMQALGSYNGGTMLFLGLGTGLGSAMIIRDHIVPMELGALSFRKGTIEECLGTRGMKKLGKKEWGKILDMLVGRFRTALLLDDIVIGGGNAKKLKAVPRGCRLGSNARAFVGGFRLWEPAEHRTPPSPRRARHHRRRRRNERHP